MKRIWLCWSLAVASMALIVGCQEETPSAVPEAKCYTPCRTGLLVEGEYVTCPSDGLLPGCLGTTTCTEGSCIAPGNEVPTCETDLDCPVFQACSDGRCLSNCDYDSDCGPGDGCFKHVCRRACSARTDSCPEQSYCSTLDGERGYCLPLAPSTGESPDSIGSFELSTRVIRLSSVENSKDIRLTNRTPMALEFTVRKVEHKEFTADGVRKDVETPLYWLEMGPAGDLEQVEEFTLLVDGDGGEAVFSLAGATNDELAVWNGVLEVSNERVGAQRIDLTYASRPDGQWAGTIYYFGNFGTLGIDAWVADKSNTALLEQVHNAFIQKWGAFRLGSLTLQELMAVVTSTRTESWSWATSRPPYCPKAACYPFDNPVGYGEYSDDLDSNPVPSGLVELPVALNLREESDPRTLVGKISTSDTLHYSGDPAITVTFAGDTSACAPGVGSACLAFVADLDADIVVGGRYLPSAGGTCDLPDFELVTVPWLVPGFEAGTYEDADTGLRYRAECRDKAQPYGDPDLQARNLTFSGSNPVPDGRSRRRHLSLVDGALVNQNELVILFRESFDDGFAFVSPDDADDFTAYGIMILERNPTTLSDEAFDGSMQTETRAMPTDKLSVGCTDAVVERALGRRVPDWESDRALLDTLAVALVDGINDDPAGVTVVDGVAEAVHYLCHDTGRFDQGPTGSSSPCPMGSHVTFFTVDPAALGQEDIEALPCQSRGSCQQDLDAWQADPGYAAYDLRLNPLWNCSAMGEVYCEDDRYDLRNGKTFYAQSSAATVFVPLRTEVNNAFRYKTAFVNRTGATVGFAPEVCIPNSNIIPYCYDPVAIEQVRERVDCLVYLHQEHGAELSATTRTVVKDYLTVDVSVDRSEPGRSRDGFEALYAELLVMQGDESYTQALASRFDLAGMRRATFEGSLFEPDGINLSGVAGHEMYTLYQAAQYYQLALDRYYALLPYLWHSLGAAAAANFVTQETVTNYFDRLIRTSTQKSRAWSEVAKRYQGFNRPDLARLVIERAYTATYLESVLITRMMKKIVDVVEPEDKDQILLIVSQAQKQYRMALLDMRDVYQGITDEVNYFGFSPDYVPFPALEDDGGSAFDMLLDSATTKAGFAAEKEVLALEKSREYETDSASFQAELVFIRNNYEDQLADLCGTFAGPDGLYYPATSKYAYLDEKARMMGDPCGLMGNGAIHEAVAGMELAAIHLRQQILRRDNKLREIDVEIQRVSDYCDEIVETSDYVLEFYGEQSNLQDEIDAAESLIATCQRAMDYGFQMAEFIKCSVGTSTDCPMTAGAMAAATAAYIGNEALLVAQDLLTAEAKSEMVKNERNKARFELSQECDIARIDSDAAVINLYIETTEIEIDILKAYYEMKLAFDGLEALRNQAKRLEVEQQDVEQLAINIEAARNDPNVRIYKNDAVINADRAFNTAIREAYKATRVYEYYTSQSYAKLDQLFLIRMVAAGDYNLEYYLTELSDAFYVFEETYGNPDVRVDVISLRDDLLNVPRLAANGEALSEAERLQVFQQMLMDPARLDEHGYLSIPFSTDLDGLSPLTRNHKISHVEAEIVGSDTGDTLGRLYLRQRGTGTVHSVTDDSLYYVFPERTAVINTFFNGDRGSFSTDEIYINRRLRDRPYSNTLWELVFNQRDEAVNQDVNLASLNDIRLYVYYTDFTEL
ncbi:MAG: hypothetical protein JXB32_21915 [Deltaproteobacteria bacterium]|nr:hypothetical protein [Deltaproteobacteria bacterium]